MGLWFLKLLCLTVIFAANAIQHSAVAEASRSSLPMDRVYQGPIRFPDFDGRDKVYSNYRTKIRNEMSTGPNFAGHYAVVTIGCGTDCNFSFIADVATGQVFNFPFGGEEYYHLSLSYLVKGNWISAKWIFGDNCIRNSLSWNGSNFAPINKAVLGPRIICEAE